MNRRFLTFFFFAFTATSGFSQDARQANDTLAPVSVAALQLRSAARKSFGEGDPAAAREHLTTLLTLCRQHYGIEPFRWCSCLAEVAREYLRAGELEPSLMLLGEAADLNLPPREEFDDGLASVAAGLHRRLAALDAGERFELLNEWSMPTESRQTVRVLTSLVPQDAPPKVFARAIGERPRDDSFPVSEINGIDGLFSTAWLLVKSAEETGRLKRLIVELTKLASEGVPAADYMLLLARIVENDQRDEQLEAVAREQLAVLQRKRPPKLTGKGPVPRDRVWQFGYTEVDVDPLRIEFKPLPYWTGSGWEGSAQHPDPTLGWTRLDATGGHAGLRFSPVRRWVAPADGTLNVVGDFQHILEQGDGVRARIVASRTGMSGEWHALNTSVSTIIESLEVRAWDTIDFVVDRVDTHGSDRFLWPVSLTLTTRDGEVLKFESAGVDPGPTTASTLTDVTLAAACLGNDRLPSIGESIIDKLLDNASRGSSPLIRPVLQRAYAVAVARRNSDTGFSDFSGTHPLHWVAANGEDSALHARGGSRALWLAHDEHVLQVTGTRSGALLFRYPLTGEFEFSCETQQGGSYPTDGGLVYGGLQFLAHSGRQTLTVHDADAAHFAGKQCPFLRSASTPVFNRLSIRSTAAGWTFAVNGHPVWEDSRLADLSPWIGLRAFGDRRPLFRNLKITGSPIIPREVRLVDDDAMRGWQSKFFGESQPSFVSATPSGEPPQASNWYVNDGTIHSAKRDVEAEANPQSRLRYQRPLLDGESISYECYYKPREIEVHPSLGRLAFLIDPDGVRLHWITDGESEWTGLSEDNAIVEPLNRRGPKPLPLQVDGWNRVNVSLTGDVVTLSLNDKVIYERSVEPKSGRQFGLFHDCRRSAVRVRNVVMTGNWPESVPDEVLSDLAATTSSNGPDADLANLNAIFREQDLATNVFAVREHAASLSDEQRFAFLLDWVLPSRGRRSFRLAGAFTTTNPAPTDAASDLDAGGQLVAPAYDLVDVAVRFNRLDELRERIAAVESSDEGQQRARFALLFLVEAARRDQTAVAVACEQLLALREKQEDFSVESLWPETLVAVRAFRSPETRTIVSELCSHLLGRLQGGKRSGLTALDHQLVSVLGQKSATASGERIDALPTLANWFPASVQTAKTRGAGQPPVRWQRRGDRVDKVAPHDIDLLYYRIPLTGDFDVECTASPYAMQEGGLMFAGVYQQYHNSEALSEGTLRSKQQRRIAPPLSQVGKMVRMRLRVRDGVCKTFLNGREVSSRQLPEHYEPWLAVYSEGCDLSTIRDLRVTGKFVVPNTVELAADEQLLGWLPYFEETLGTQANGASWQYRADPAGSRIVGVKEEDTTASFKESLLQYHRPMVEDGAIEYEFYYEPGQTLAHPALDRLAFLLDPDGVKVHWVTDGAYSATSSDPTNQTVEPNHRRGGALPLRVKDWNRMTIELRGDTVGLTLNGQLIYERLLTVANQRTFGLFHFADQTEVRVRRVVLRGDWPKSVPPASEQELADKTVSSLDETQARLPAEFSHSFVGGGFPSAYFRPVPAKPGHQFALLADGLFTGVTGRESWESVAILPRFTVQGDFDIEVGFDQLALRGQKTAAIMLHTEHVGDQRPHYRVLRTLGQRDLERLQASIEKLHSDGTRRYSAIQTDSCESSSGRLRLARRGETIYYLFAEGDSTAFRVIATQLGSAAETVPEGIQFQAMCSGTSSVNVVWKNISMRAEKMTYFPPDDRPATRKLMVMNADGSEVREVTGLPAGYSNLGSPEWSADGKQIAFDVSPGNFADSHIIVVNTDGTGVRDCGPGAMPSFSPDGKRIVFCQPGGGVMMMNADGSNRTDIDVGGWGAQWSPDGKWIAWGRGGNIIVMSADTKREKPILVGDQATLFNSTFWNLGWSHDSRSIAFKARNQKTGGEDIVVADIDSPDGFKILLASGTGVHPDFSFGPDNKRILFAMNNPRHKGPQLYTLDRDKDGPPQLLRGQPPSWIIYNGAWSPDGTWIAFTGEKIPQPVDWPIAEASTAEKR